MTFTCIPRDGQVTCTKNLYKIKLEISRKSFLRSKAWVLLEVS